MMITPMTPQEFVRAALECSIYFRPADPGLTEEEVREVARQTGRKLGEIGDALAGFAVRMGNPRLEPTTECIPRDFNFRPDPDFRNPMAFDFVDLRLRENLAEAGVRGAGLTRETLGAHAAIAGIPERDVQVAITMGLLVEHLLEKPGGLIGFGQGGADHILATEQIRQNLGQEFRKRKLGRTEVHEAVRDVIERRTDTRALYANALDAFSEKLGELGHTRFRVWWAQTCSEFNLATPQMPTITCVLAAALAEGALAFVVGRARALNLATMNSTVFGDSPTRWTFDKLLDSATRGGPDAIFDAKLRDRAERLNTVRQRIHAGRLMAQDGPVPDTCPEEATEARETVQAILRQILDWLERHPNSEAGLTHA
jgi:hypothetical protein